MTYAQAFNFFKDKRGNKYSKYTNEIIKYLRDGDYTQVAIVSGVSCPSQWWHLMQYILKYYEWGKENRLFNERVSCGELIFWMAEASEALDKDELKGLIEEIKCLPKKERNPRIKEKCWTDIKRIVEDYDKK